MGIDNASTVFKIRPNSLATASAFEIDNINNATFAGQVKIDASVSDDVSALIYNSHATPKGQLTKFTGASPDNNTQYLARFDDSTTTRCVIWSDGDLANHDGVYGTISARELKQDFTPMRSYYEDFSKLNYQKYRMKSDVEVDENANYRLGLVHDEVKELFPALAPNEGVDGWVKSSIIEGPIMASVVQEMMAKIEELEAKVKALENV